ncbi:hypothetical protein GCM10010347_46140 [Streptomyces cirratus]|uniref:Lipoprotein n=1 Tax=Streptomyces cirratus TaxID=68187 RepID=A0ABQ3F1M7_9ACTN|nr:hypothetical protein GCM10010347_46140 [Streptomyces cirratus]
MLLRIALICAVLGTGCAAWTSSGVGRMHSMDIRELRRQQRFKHVLTANSATAKTRGEGAPAVSGTAGVSVCTECGAASGPL